MANDIEQRGADLVTLPFPLSFATLPQNIHDALAGFLSALDLTALSQTSQALHHIYSGLSWANCIVCASAQDEELRAYQNLAQRARNFAFRTVPWAAIQAPQRYAWFARQSVRRIRLAYGLEEQLGPSWYKELDLDVSRRVYPALKHIEVRQQTFGAEQTEGPEDGGLVRYIYSFKSVVSDGDGDSIGKNLLRLQLANVVEIGEISFYNLDQVNYPPPTDSLLVLENLTEIGIGTMPRLWFDYIVSQTRFWPNLRVFRTTTDVFISAQGEVPDAKFFSLQQLPEDQLAVAEVHADASVRMGTANGGGDLLAPDQKLPVALRAVSRLHLNRVTDLKQQLGRYFSFPQLEYLVLNNLTDDEDDDEKLDIKPIDLVDFAPALTHLWIDLDYLVLQQQTIQSLSQLSNLTHLHISSAVRLEDENYERERYYTVASCLQDVFVQLKQAGATDLAGTVRDLRHILEPQHSAVSTKLLCYYIGSDMVQLLSELVENPVGVLDLLAGGNGDEDLRLFLATIATLECVFSAAVPALTGLRYLSVSLADEYVMAASSPGLRLLLQETGLRNPQRYALQQVKLFGSLHRHNFSTVDSLFDVAPWYPYRFFHNYRGDAYMSSVLYDVKQKRNLDVLVEESAVEYLTAQNAEGEMFLYGFDGWLR